MNDLIAPGAPVLVQPPRTLAAMLPIYTAAMETRHYSPHTIRTQIMLMRWFVAFCAEREMHDLHAVTRELVERYQRHLYLLRVKAGAPLRGGSSSSATSASEQPAAVRPLTIAGQHGRLWAVVRFFRWCVRAGYLEHTPAGVIELPRLPKRLPKPALSVAEVEQVLAMPDLTTAAGLRDRAMLEVLYATGIRRAELVALTLEDIDRERKLIRVQQGKGRKGRLTPISQRALLWIDRYQREVWARFPQAMDHRRVFIRAEDAQVAYRGRPIDAQLVTRLLGNYLVASGVSKAGACHIYRHTAATLMMENGADIRAIQDFLGHSDLKTTGIYTNVSFKFLQEQHAKTHPSAMAQPETDMRKADSPTSGAG